MQVSRGYKGSRSEAPDPDLHTFPQDYKYLFFAQVSWRLEAFDQSKDSP